MDSFDRSVKKTLWKKRENDGHKHFLLSFACFRKIISIWVDEKLAIVNAFPNKPWFLRVSCKSLLKTLWEKEKLLVLFPQYFLPAGGIFCHFHPFRNCRLQTLSVWKRVKIKDI